ncbi:uncharacterized protein G2W53_001463 [Senna tora]|uniref:Uncharacterized protein n=1 Tax=Senna tora TaxID=362788 RepID=A0A834XJR1_9FABA|nr:uncharacterized protein G2W53_001463 [Senna tora]
MPATVRQLQQLLLPPLLPVDSWQLLSYFPIYEDNLLSVLRKLREQKHPNDCCSSFPEDSIGTGSFVTAEFVFILTAVTVDFSSLARASCFEEPCALIAGICCSGPDTVFFAFKGGSAPKFMLVDNCSGSTEGIPFPTTTGCLRDSLPLLLNCCTAMSLELLAVTAFVDGPKCLEGIVCLAFADPDGPDTSLDELAWAELSLKPAGEDVIDQCYAHVPMPAWPAWPAIEQMLQSGCSQHFGCPAKLLVLVLVLSYLQALIDPWLVPGLKAFPHLFYQGLPSVLALFAFPHEETDQDLAFVAHCPEPCAGSPGWNHVELIQCISETAEAIAWHGEMENCYSQMPLDELLDMPQMFHSLQVFYLIAVAMAA